MLRGQAANFGTPVFNRLYWNFSHAEGEAAYVMKYNITDINRDGFIDVKDAATGVYTSGFGTINTLGNIGGQRQGTLVARLTF